ncbi:MAG: hypothetical protein HFJ12_07030 [Bacilli bacterium]|nr:hypothetical protein [Bacilli bacterium]
MENKNSDFLADLSIAAAMDSLHGDTRNMDRIRLEALEKELKEVKQRQIIEKQKLEKRVKKIPFWVIEGNKIIDPHLIPMWNEYVTSYAINGSGEGEEYDVALEIMTHLKNDETMDFAKQILEKATENFESSKDIFSIQNIIFTFSAKGPDFVEQTLNRELSLEEKEVFDKKREENLAHHKEMDLIFDDTGKFSLGKNNIIQDDLSKPKKH